MRIPSGWRRRSYYAQSRRGRKAARPYKSAMKPRKNLSEERNDRPGRQNAPVTGAASGIGKALAAAPIARGARVMADIGGQTLAGAAAALGPRAIPMTCDLAEPALAALGLREPD